MTQEQFDKKLDEIFETLRRDGETYLDALHERFAPEIAEAEDDYRLPKNAAIAILLRMVNSIGGFQYGEYSNGYAKENRRQIRMFNPDIPAL